ncbi:DUF4383 domain-containing protein [Blastococcus sp. SYSU DS0753]
MALRPHLRRTGPAAGAPPAAGAAAPPAAGTPTPPASRTRPAPSAPPAGGRSPGGDRVLAVHRIGALLVAAVIAVFGILGFADGLEFFSTDGERILGLSSNGLLSTISVVTAAVLVAAALRGPHIASTVMIVVGVLFLVSALANLAVLQTGLNVLAFRFANVVFSVVAGLVLLLLGAYGRVSGNLPPDSPYARPGSDAGGDDPAADHPSTPAEFAAERAMRDAEVAVVQHTATPDQQRRVSAMSAAHSRAERRRIWLSFDAPTGGARPQVADQ